MENNCTDCYNPTTFGWCMKCETNYMKEKFLYWSSENKEIDELICHTQLNASHAYDYLEWIPFEAFDKVTNIGRGGLSSVYSALWMEGPRQKWDYTTQIWTRTGPIKVALKHLVNSLNISGSYVDQIKAHYKCIQSDLFVKIFGITKDPTSNYMIVMKYSENGNLYQYLNRSKGILLWGDKIKMSQKITKGLEKVHIEGKTHRNLHGGNLLIEDEENSIDARIGDVGLYGPCYDHEDENSGIIMNTLATGERPWYNRAHDYNLAKDICNGLRPAIPDDTPKFYADLMQQCWSNEPENRPTASFIYERLSWYNLFCDYNYYDEKNRYKMHPHLKIHPEAYYTSRLLYFPEL
ncbi:unnamed protein product [Rhizophagus irregularis]|nr:unnamed protein product [Rhizophagus irregularis]